MPHEVAQGAIAADLTQKTAILDYSDKSLELFLEKKLEKRGL